MSDRRAEHKSVLSAHTSSVLDPVAVRSTARPDLAFFALANDTYAELILRLGIGPAGHVDGGCWADDK